MRPEKKISEPLSPGEIISKFAALQGRIADAQGAWIRGEHSNLAFAMTEASKLLKEIRASETIAAKRQRQFPLQRKEA